MEFTEEQAGTLARSGSFLQLGAIAQSSSDVPGGMALLELERYRSAEANLEVTHGGRNMARIGLAVAKLELGKKGQAKELLLSVGPTYEPETELLLALGLAQCEGASGELDSAIMRLGSCAQGEMKSFYDFVLFAFGGKGWPELRSSDLDTVLRFDVSRLLWSAFLYQSLDHLYVSWLKTTVMPIFPGYGPRLCLLQLALNDLDEAQRTLEANAHEWNVLPTFHQALGHIATRRSRREDARGHYAEAAEISPGSIRFLADLADADFRLGRFDSAARLVLEIAAEIDPREAYPFLKQVVDRLIALGLIALSATGKLISPS